MSEIKVIGARPFNRNPNEPDKLSDVYNPYAEEFIEFTKKQQWPVYFWDERLSLIKAYSYAIPSDYALKRLSIMGPIIEMGAGSGYWAQMLRFLGTHIVAYDNSKFSDNPYGFSTCWGPIEKGSFEVLKNFNYKTLLMVWPCYNENWAFKCLKEFKGQTVVYVGEGDGGCTADDEFHKQLSEDWDLVETLGIHQWPGVHDEMYIYNRKETIKPLTEDQLLQDLDL